MLRRISIACCISILKYPFPFLVLVGIIIDNQQEVIRFNELQRRLEGISSVMLSKSLEELERARLVHREQYPEIPPRVEYSLTALGRSIDPYLRALGEWGMQAYEAIQAG